MVQTTNEILMCLFEQPKPPEVKPPAPPPTTPKPPEAPKALSKEEKSLEEPGKEPKVDYGTKKSTETRAKKGTDSLRIPLGTPSPGSNTGGLNV
tara:strand:+ start:337 stop:618 length:282 start_codon:yes stop_codon:yes gene_type:complete